MNGKIFIDETDYTPPPEEINASDNASGLAGKSLKLAIVSAALVCMGIGFFIAPVSLIMGIVALVKSECDRNKAVAAILISLPIVLLTVLFVGYFVYISVEYPGAFDQYDQSENSAYCFSYILLY